MVHYVTHVFVRVQAIADVVFQHKVCCTLSMGRVCFESHMITMSLHCNQCGINRYDGFVGSIKVSSTNSNLFFIFSAFFISLAHV